MRIHARAVTAGGAGIGAAVGGVVGAVACTAVATISARRNAAGSGRITAINFLGSAANDES